MARQATAALARLRSGAQQVSLRGTRQPSSEVFRRLALHDPLTGLANRTLLGDRIEHALARHERHAHLSPPALLVIDLDDFKVVNDSLGHAAGDAVLVEVSRRLRATVREVDTVARTGGDEFAILLDADGEHAVGPATVAARVIEAIARPIALDDGCTAQVAASVGVVLPVEGERASQLLAHADAAMYAAKQGGKGRFASYDVAMQTQVARRQSLESSVRSCSARGQLRLDYQALVHADTGSVAGVEALVRWDHPTCGLILPAEFLPIAERAGMAASVGRWLLEEACAQALCWRRQLPALGPLLVTVNVSARHLTEPWFADDLRAAIDATGIAPASLVLEISEQALVDGSDPVLQSLKAALRLGVGVALDDFGAGRSSLLILARLPLSMLKIDGRLFGAGDPSPATARMIATVVELANSLGLQVVAEGVERRRQAELVASFPRALAQGHFYGRAVDAEAMGRWLSDHAQGAVSNERALSVRRP